MRNTILFIGLAASAAFINLSNAYASALAPATAYCIREAGDDFKANSSATIAENKKAVAIKKIEKCGNFVYMKDRGSFDSRSLRTFCQAKKGKFFIPQQVQTRSTFGLSHTAWGDISDARL